MHYNYHPETQSFMVCIPCLPEDTSTMSSLIEKSFTSLAKPKKKIREQKTIIRNGEIYYGKIVNYTTGPCMSYASFPDNGKPRSFSKAMKLIIAGRKWGDFMHEPLPTPQATGKLFLGPCSESMIEG